MGKCVVCNDFLPPHFMVDIPVKDLPKDQDTPQKCAYCATGKNQVTMVIEDGEDSKGNKKYREEKITKEEAKKRYQIFLKKLSETKNIKDILTKAKNLGSGVK